MPLIDVLNVTRGERKIVIDDNDPADRKKKADDIANLLRKGTYITLEHGSETRVITGYDPETNEWVLKPQARTGKAERTPAAGTTATAVAPSAGG